MDSSALVFLHITAGGFALVAGGTALFARKGRPLHRMAGNVFFIAMLGLGTSGAVVAVMRNQSLNVAAALVTLYLVSTAWKAATRKDGESGGFEIGAFVFALIIAAGGALVGWTRADGATPFLYGFASIAAFAAVMDLSVIVRRGVSGAQRIARHLWRMTLAMFIATASFFLGQAKFIPEAVRDANLHFVPPIAVIALLLFWVVRVLLTKWYSRAEAAPLP